VTAADWIIVMVIAVSVLQAAISGFFHEAFGIAGLILGYLLAAWNYERLAARYAPYLKSMWLGEIAAFLVIFWRLCWLPDLRDALSAIFLKKLD
jgi:membrane protein required for colicin V production